MNPGDLEKKYSGKNKQVGDDDAWFFGSAIDGGFRLQQGGGAHQD
jgi:hypothetical protein